MSTFKVGQRVRVVGAPKRNVQPNGPSMVGREATVIGPLTIGDGADGRPFWGYPIDVDGIGRLNHAGRQTIARPEYLAPLTDPSADEWADAQIAKLKKLGPLPVKEVA